MITEKTGENEIGLKTGFVDFIEQNSLITLKGYSNNKINPKIRNLN